MGDRVVQEAVQVERDGDLFRVHTLSSGSAAEVKAREIIVAAGAMTSVALGLRPPGVAPLLDINLQTSQAVLFEVEPKELDVDMPVMIYHGREDPAQRWYMLPPIRYPDGKVYLKIGYDGDALQRRLSSEA